jgi:hypothetical protein
VQNSGWRLQQEPLLAHLLLTAAAVLLLLLCKQGPVLLALILQHCQLCQRRKLQLLCTVLEVSHASSWAVQKSACTVEVDARDLGDEHASSLAAWLSRYAFLASKLSVRPRIGRDHSTEQLVSQALVQVSQAPASTGSSTAPPNRLHLSALTWSHPETFSVLRAAQASKELTSLTLHHINGMTSGFPPALASLTSLQELDVSFRSSSQWQSGFHGRYRQFLDAVCKLPLTSLTAKTMALNSQGLLQLPASLCMHRLWLPGAGAGDSIPWLVCDSSFVPHILLKLLLSTARMLLMSWWHLDVCFWTCVCHIAHSQVLWPHTHPCKWLGGRN